MRALDRVAPSSGDLRAVLGRFCTGVTVITADDADEGPRGMTANAFMSGSLTPALILVSVRRDARLHATLQAAGTFGVSILPESLEGEARRFAGLPTDGGDDVAPGFAWRDGVPVLSGALAWLTAEVAQRHGVGAHTLFVGSVLDCGYSETDMPPLAYFRSAFARVATVDGRDGVAIDPWGASHTDLWG